MIASESRIIDHATLATLIGSHLVRLRKINGASTYGWDDPEYPSVTAASLIVEDAVQDEAYPGALDQINGIQPNAHFAFCIGFELALRLATLVISDPLTANQNAILEAVREARESLVDSAEDIARCAGIGATT